VPWPLLWQANQARNGAYSPAAELGNDRPARGAACSRWWALQNLVVCCPVGRRFPSTGSTLHLLILPEYDQIGYGKEWQRYASAKSWPTWYIRDAGQDISNWLPLLLRENFLGRE
jgi:hypothetical protein